MLISGIFYAVLFSSTIPPCKADLFQVQTDEVFMIPLSPQWFNMSSLGFPAFEYAASLYGLPDLPKWIQLVYNPMLKLGFLFGTPPLDADYVKLDLAATNQVTYEAKSKDISLEVYPKQDPAERRIKLKIHNLNVEHLMDERYQTRLFDVFRANLWPDCAPDLHFVEILSALAVGGRRPARLTDGEGVIVTLGSRAEFSETMRELEREVSSLWPLKNCPRDFKKTSAERHFRSKGFIIDWCSFKLIPQNSSLLVSSTPSPSEPLVPSSTASSMSDYESQTGRSIYSKSQFPDDEDIWRSPAKWETPTRSYLEEGVVAVFLPIVLLLVLAGLLTAILGVHPEGAETEEGQLYESVFEELPFVKPKPEVKQTVFSSKDPISSLSRKSIVQAHDSTLLPPKQTESTTASLNRITNKRTATLQHEEKASNVSSSARGSIDSPFLMSVNSSHCPTPVSTLSRNTTIQRSTLGSQRPQPPPYNGTLPRTGTLNRN